MSGIALKPASPGGTGGHNNLLQSGFWGRLKSEFGWKAVMFEFTSSDGFPPSPLLVLVRDLGAGQSLAYVPHGPMLGDVSAEEAASAWNTTALIADAVRPHLPESCMFIRFDPPWGMSIPALSDENPEYPSDLLRPSSAPGVAELFRKSEMDIQPPSTVILDLGASEDELLAGMKSKTRYNIRLAAKKGVEVRTAGIDALPGWYELYRITAERDKIALHSYEYYERFFSLSVLAADGPEPAPRLRLLQAVIDDSVEAGIIICFYGTPGVDMRATYLYGASSNNKRNYMPSYALQWEAVKQASEAGCVSYDFFGIPPADDPNHPMHGLYRFKTGFGGNILHRPGCWDFPYKKTAYSAFRAAERVRNFYYKKLRKR